jgi:hypothetical protein
VMGRRSRKRPFTVKGMTLAGEHRDLTVDQREGVDVYITVDGQVVPLFPQEARALGIWLIEATAGMTP